MTQDEVFNLVVRHIRHVLPSLHAHVFTPTDSLRTLGANSLDRVDIIMMTLDSLSLNIPLTELAKARNVGELAGIIHARS